MKEISKKKWRRKRIHHISPTGAISKFTDCPLQFWFYKIGKFPDKANERPYLIFGNAIHAAQEFLLQSKLDNKQLSQEDTKHVFEQYMTEQAAKASIWIWGRDGIIPHMDMGNAMISLMIKRYNTMPIKPLIIEKEYSSKWDKDIYLNCRIDLVAEFLDDWSTTNGDRINRGDIVIIDHKTSAQRYKDNAVHISDQLTFYSHILRNIELIRENAVMFQNFMKYKEPEIQDYLSKRTEKDMIIFDNKLSSIIKAIDNDFFIPTFKPDICNRCDYSSECMQYAIIEERHKKEVELAKQEGYMLV